MATAKDLIVKPIKSADANAFVKAHHYSGKVAKNSQLHLGVFLDGRLHGVMQFGPSLDKRKIQGLVSGTQWHEFLELNRMAFDDVLPRNSESRALAIAWRLLRKHAPQVKWVVSFADGTQCGDGTIYRAAGFVLTGITSNKSILVLPDGYTCALPTLAAQGKKGGEKEKAEVQRRLNVVSHTTISKAKHSFKNSGSTSIKPYLDAGAKFLEGFQLRYIFFIDPAYRARLTAPELPYSEIKARGATMYKGQRPTGETGEIDNAPQTNEETGGASPTVSLLQEESHGTP
jgi:hypothetical protein